MVEPKRKKTIVGRSVDYPARGSPECSEKSSTLASEINALKGWAASYPGGCSFGLAALQHYDETQGPPKGESLSLQNPGAAVIAASRSQNVPYPVEWSTRATRSLSSKHPESR